jgi:hypothetical protein
MARVAQLEQVFHVPHIGDATAVGGVLSLLAAVGSVAFKAASGLRHALARWQERRHEHAEDRKLWELACQDSRVMADLVALSQATSRAWPPAR